MQFDHTVIQVINNTGNLFLETNERTGGSHEHALLVASMLHRRFKSAGFRVFVHREYVNGRPETPTEVLG